MRSSIRLRKPGRRVFDGGAHERRDLAQRLGLGDELPAGALRRLGLDAAHAGGDRSLRDDADEADVAGAARMGAAAELDRKGARSDVDRRMAHGDDAHFIAVFLAEQRARAGANGLVLPHQPRLDRRIVLHHRIGDLLDGGDLFLAQGLWMGEVEAQPVGRDERAFLRDMIAEHAAQRLM